MMFQSNERNEDGIKNNRIPELHGIWDSYVPDEGKTERAKKVKFASCDISSENAAAECLGSSGEIYKVSLHDCTCVDFSKNRRLKPCKHMIALAMKCKALDDQGLTYAQDCARTTYELATKLALAYAFYHLYKKPIISDSAYDALKYELWDWCEWVEEDDVRDAEITKTDEKMLVKEPLPDFMKRVMCLVKENMEL